ncbi:hypothetical protein CFIMG_007973RA00001 [Ceratocystis fimbriata CBS 114723]|uniref:Uncharacterized protein n=1 Tax=Ceratocystis fimbriata CBS 114723 TaxID=1035309 RepID=A0A2C5WZQ0_9PEZI|nr:hypothetical protein CFIMG_007973RA00001 [Ceratocystis fimbriata CBS 114723]
MDKESPHGKERKEEKWLANSSQQPPSHALALGTNARARTPDRTAGAAQSRHVVLAKINGEPLDANYED